MKPVAATPTSAHTIISIFVSAGGDGILVVYFLQQFQKVLKTVTSEWDFMYVFEIYHFGQNKHRSNNNQWGMN